MTIKGLWDLLKKYNLEHVYLAEDFKGYRIAIDADGFTLKFRIRARIEILRKTDITFEDIDEDEVDKLWLEYCHADLNKLIELGITPIMANDGDSPPEKEETRLERNKALKKILDDISELKDKIRKGDILRTNAKDIALMRTYESRNIVRPSESKKKLTKYLNEVGIPSFRCYNGYESEKTCCALVKEKIASAVFSADCDCLVHLPEDGILIRDYGDDYIDELGESKKTFRVIRKEDVLSALKMNNEQFRDLCILAGCDYNRNIKGLGIVRMRTLIEKHKSFDNFPGSFFDKYEDQIEALRYERCLELFTYENSLNLFNSMTFFGLDDTPRDYEGISFEVKYDKSVCKETVKKYEVNPKCILPYRCACSLYIKPQDFLEDSLIDIDIHFSRQQPKERYKRNKKVSTVQDLSEIVSKEFLDEIMNDW